MKVADVRLGWTRSPSSDVTKVEVVTKIDGAETKIEFGPEVQEMVVEVKASASVQFQVVTYDAQGNQATSETHTFVLDDLEAPQPATGLFHEIVGVREIPDEAPSA